MPQSIPIKDLIRQEAEKAKVPPALAFAVADQESGFDPTKIGPPIADSPERAIGTFQLLPSTAKLLVKDPHNPVENIEAGVQYLRQLLDRHQGDLSKVLADYGGVKTNTTYVPSVMAKLVQYQQAENQQPAAAPPAATPPAPGQSLQLTLPTQAAAAPTPATPATPAPGAPPPPPSPWGYGFISDLARNVRDYTVGTPEARANTAGAIGGIGGGIIGGPIGGGIAALLGAPTGPGEAAAIPAGVITGRRIGSAAGAGALGGAERYVEELLGTAPPPPPGEEGSTAFSRALDVGGEQAKLDVGGQMIGLGLGWMGKPMLQTRIGRAALKGFQDTHTAAVAKLQSAVDVLDQQAKALRQRVGRFGESIGEAMGVTRQAAGDRARAGVADVVGDVRARVGRAQAFADSGVLGAQQAAEREAQAARDALTSTEATQEAHYASQVGTAPPNPIESGRAVTEAFEGPIQKERNRLGEALDAVAETGPDLDITGLKAEAARIATEELAPPLHTFPRSVPPEPSPLVPGAAPPITTDLNQVAQDIGAAQYEELKKHPAMAIVQRILNAPDTVPFHDAHLWKSQLQKALAGTYDQARKSQVTSITQHLAGGLRDALSVYKPYNKANDAYGAVAQLFTEGYGEQLAAAARFAPEKIIQMIKPNDPSYTKMLVTALTDVASRGGTKGGVSKKGAALGAKALSAVQDAWLHRNVIQGPLSGLKGRLGAVLEHPEFVQALFPDAPAQNMLQNLAHQADTYEALVADARLEIAQQLRRGREAVRTAKATGKAAVGDLRQQGAAEIRAARAGNLADKRALEGTTADVERATKWRGQDQLADMDRQMDAARIALREGKVPPPEMTRFLESTLGPKNLRKAEQVAADAFNAAFHHTGVWGGLSMYRLIKGASDRDLMLYAAKSPNMVDRFFANHIWGSARPGWVAAQLSRFSRTPDQGEEEEAGSNVGAPPPPPP